MNFFFLYVTFCFIIIIMFVTSKHQSNGSTCALLKLQDGEINHNK